MMVSEGPRSYLYDMPRIDQFSVDGMTNKITIQFFT